MGSRKIARDRLDAMWRRWQKKSGYGWADYLKRKTSEIGATYAMPMEHTSEIMNYAYRAGFEEGLREAKRGAGSAGEKP